MTHPNLDLLQRLDKAFNDGDFDTVLAAFSDDCEVHISGGSSFAGDYQGKEAMGNLMMQYMGALGDDPQVSTHALLADDDHGVMLQKVAATKAGQTIDIETVNVFHLSDGQITAMWSVDTDQRAADAFYDL